MMRLNNLFDEAESKEVLSYMTDIISKYGFVTFADLRGILDVTPHPFDHIVGWYEINNAQIVKVEGGYKITLPSLTQLKQEDLKKSS